MSTALYPRELSWLSFNERVLQEAADPNVPLIERVRFLGIYSNNQDEFFRVRVADVRRQILYHTGHDEKKAAEARELLDQIQDKVMALSERFEEIYQEIVRSLARKGVFLVHENQLEDDQKVWLLEYFRKNILRFIAPIFLDADQRFNHEIEDDAGYLFVKLTRNKKDQYALIEIPTDQVDRFIELPRGKGRRQRTFILLDNAIRLGLDYIFGPVTKYNEAEAWAMKLTRDADYDLVDEIDMSFMEQMDEGLRQRLTAAPTRLVYDRDMPAEALLMLKRGVGITDHQSLVAGGRYHNFKDFMKFPTNLARQGLVNKPLPAMESPRFGVSRNYFKSIRAGDILLYYPYHTFNHFTELLRQAAYDPKVKKIQITLYRVASDSLVIKSLIDAAHNGKKVQVVLELQARFDEQNNLEWARVLQDAGVKVSFGINQLKVHAKLCLIERQESGLTVPYAYFGTGNFHEGTARVYTDFGLFTRNPELCEEAANVFAFIDSPYKRFRFRHLWVSPNSQRNEIFKRINREMENVATGKKGMVRAKINNLVDRGLIEKLYEASQAGVKIKLIIRGMCSLVTGRPESKNIEIISVVDRFLEHPRLVEFHNGGEPEVYISSADWMTRNLDRRVEVGAPILDPVLRARVSQLLDVQWADRAKARVIDQTQSNPYVPRGNRRKIRSQHRTYDIIARWDRDEDS